jgi:uncharacterized protein YcfJ
MKKYKCTDCGKEFTDLQIAKRHNCKGVVEEKRRDAFDDVIDAGIGAIVGGLLSSDSPSTGNSESDFGGFDGGDGGGGGASGDW